MTRIRVSKNTHTAFVLGIVLIVCSMSNGELPSDQYVVATAHYRAGRWKLAAAEFQEFIHHFPHHTKTTSATFYLGESLVQLRQFHDAADAFEHVVVRHPSDQRADRALFRWGETLMLAGDDAAANRLLEQFHDRHPEHQLNEFALYYLGNLAAKRSDSQAIEHYAELLKSFPDTKHAAEARLQLGLQYYRSGDLGNAMKQLGLVETNYPLTEARESIHLRVRSRYWMGVTQLARKDFEHAAKTLQSVVAISPEHPLAAAASYFAGETFRSSQRLDQADRAYAAVLQQHKHCEWTDDAIVGRIRIALAKSQHELVDQLAQEFTDAFGDSERTVDILETRSRSLIARRDFRKAKPLLMHGIQIAEARSQQDNSGQLNSLRFMAGLCCLGQDEWQDALHFLDQIDLKSSETLRARAVLARGCAKLELGNYPEATADLQVALSELVDESMQDRCRAKLVQAHLAQEQNVSAETLFRSIKGKKETSRFESAQRIADKLFKQNEYARAISYYQQLRQCESPEFNATGYQGVAWCQYHLGNYRDAASALRAFIEAHPKHEFVCQSMFMLAKCWEEEGNLQSAIAVLQHADWQGDDVIAANAAIAQARLLDSIGKQQAAIIALEEAIQDSTISRPHLDGMTYQLAWLYYNSDQQAAAAKAFQTIHNQYPDSPFWPDATFRLATIQTEQYKREQASESLDRLFAFAPESEVHAQALLLKAKLFAQHGQWQESLAVVERLANEFCHLEMSGDAEYWQAEANFRIENFDAAEQQFAALARRPDTDRKSEWQALVPLRRAQLMAMKADWRSAAEQARFVLKHHPDFSQAFEAEYLLGRCLAAQGRFAAARKYYDNVVSSGKARKTETAAMAQWMIGESYFHQRKYEEAIRAYLKVDILYDNHHWQAAALLQAAKCFELTNELHNATELYTRLVSDFPDTPFAAQAADRRNTIVGNVKNDPVYRNDSQSTAAANHHSDLK